VAGSVASRALKGVGVPAASIASSVMRDTASLNQARVSTGAFSHRSTLELGGDIFGRTGSGPGGAAGDAARGAATAGFHRRATEEQELRLRSRTKQRKRREPGAPAAQRRVTGRIVAGSARDEEARLAALAAVVPVAAELRAVRSLGDALQALGRSRPASSLALAAAALVSACEACAAAEMLPPRAEVVLAAVAEAKAAVSAGGAAVHAASEDGMAGMAGVDTEGAIASLAPVLPRCSAAAIAHEAAQWLSSPAAGRSAQVPAPWTADLPLASTARLAGAAISLDEARWQAAECARGPRASPPEPPMPSARALGVTE